jgi:hypothetical protein
VKLIYDDRNQNNIYLGQKKGNSAGKGMKEGNFWNVIKMFCIFRALGLCTCNKVRTVH